MQLGGWNEASKRQQAEAAQRAEALRLVIEEIVREGAQTYSAIATELNRRRIKPVRKGSKWHAMTAMRLCRRITATLPGGDGSYTVVLRGRHP